MSWLTEEERGNITPDLLEELADRVFNKAVDRALALIPHALGGLLKYATNITNIQESYRKANPDLADHEERLKELIGVTSSDHTDWDIAKIVEESGKDLRKEIKTISSIGAIDLDSIDRPSEEDLNGKLKDS